MQPDDGRSVGVLTIGELARFAGVTVRTVRHYHVRGLLPEPPRDASGYRRYGAQAAVDLLRIRVLAAAGVPLARVGELLRAEPEQFARAVDEVDRELRSRIRDLQRHRADVAGLVSGDGLALPPAVVAYLEALRQAGLPERVVGMERDGWILIAAHAPERVVDWTKVKHELLADPVYRDIYVRFGQAVEWAPDDPRLVVLADDMIGYFTSMPAERRGRGRIADGELPADLARLLDAQTLGGSPAWTRLNQLLTARGAAVTEASAPRL